VRAQADAPQACPEADALASAAATRLEQAVAEAEAIEDPAGQWRSLLHLAQVRERPQGGAGQPCYEAAVQVIEASALRLCDADVRAAFLSAPMVSQLKREAADAVQPVTVRRLRAALPMRLIAREIEVLQWVARGLSNRETAAALTISERTVNSHLVRIFNKLEVHSRAAATAQAIRLGIAG
jgi:DNA-binding CsgD family transcriptional regulator